MAALQWETIQFDQKLQTRTDRLNVIGGWLVRTMTVVQVIEPKGEVKTDIRVNTVFIADPGHHWVVEVIPVSPPAVVQPQQKPVEVPPAA